MNKAFVREPDDTGERHCPRCGSLGESVGRVTLEGHLPSDVASGLSEPAFFCPFAQCPVAYFDLYERLVTTEVLLRPVYPKDPEAPLCGCFGLTRDDIEADLAEGGVRRVRQCVERAKSAEARCQSCSPNGRSCVAEVQRYYMKRRAQRDGG